MKWLFLLFPLLGFAQTKIYISNINADYKIFIDKHANSADKWVSINKTNTYFTEWEVVEHRNQAQKVVDIVQYRNLADFSVHILNRDCKKGECLTKE